MKRKNNKGFTLIELLAVIVILGIIITIVVTNVTKYIKQSKQGAYRDAVGVFIKNTQTQVLASDISGVGGMVECTTNNDCKDKYEYDTSNMSIVVSENNGIYSISIEGIGGFQGLDMSEDSYKYCPKEANSTCTSDGKMTIKMNKNAEIQ